MTIRSTVTEQAAVVEMAGSVAAVDLSRLHSHLVDLLRARRRKIILDFRAVDHVSYQDASSLAREFELVRSYNADLRIEGISPYVRNILLFAGLFDVLDAQGPGTEGSRPARTSRAS